MRLSTERLLLRPVTLADTDDLFRIYGDPATQTFNPAGPMPDIAEARETLAQWVALWQSQGWSNFAVALAHQPQRVIGFGGLRPRTYGSLTINNLGYRFATEAWGKGLATEFATRLIAFGFEDAGLDDISALVRQNHQASQRVLEKSGLRRVREIKDVKNAPPSFLYHISREVWQNQRGQ